MHFTFENVNDAFTGLVSGIASGEIPTAKRPSRNGNVMMIGEPVTITYNNPRRRVLFNAARDANPFFHLFESLWMLAGRNDVAPLKYYVSSIDQFSDDGNTFNGAYGWRWRSRDYWDQYCNASPGDVPTIQIDQLQILIKHLKENPTSRRAVLQMWNVEDDLRKIDESKDVCCNLSVCFSLRETRNPRGEFGSYRIGYRIIEPPKSLDMTVFNRSNDLVLGALGANVVHFSFLQEYIACALGVEVGRYHQVTNNLHVYDWNWKPEEWLSAVDPSLQTMHDPEVLSYNSEFVHVPIGYIDQSKLDAFVEANKNCETITQGAKWGDEFLDAVAQPMCHAFHMHKQRDYAAAGYWLEWVDADDWVLAGEQWITKRENNWERKQKGQTDA